MTLPSTCDIRVDLDEIEEMLRLDLDPRAKVRALHLLSDSTRTGVFQADLEGGPSVVIKVRRWEQGTFDVEAFQLAHLAERSPLPVPRVLAYRKDGAPGPYTYLILSAVPGIPWARFHASTGPDQRARLQRDLGSLMGRLHRQCVAPAFGEVRPSGCRSYKSWPDFFSSLWEERIEGVLTADRLDPQTLDAIEWIHKSLGRLLALRDVPRLTHGNLSASNILCVEEGGEWRVSGFCNPCAAYAHREVDLALLELRLGVEESFFEGYREHIPIDPEYAARKWIYMLYFALEDVRVQGQSHQVLQVIDLVQGILRTATV